jgi:hypothetical protein
MCVNGFCTAACVAEGGVCDENQDCCAGAQCVQVVTGELRCRCSGPGDVCDANSDCCGDGVCVGGECTESCVPRGGVCDASSTDECCADADNCRQLISGPSGWRCGCSLAGGICNQNNDCCDDLICNAGSCTERCALSDCTECQTCDPASGVCFDVEDETPCSIGICNNGECFRTCPNGNGDCVAELTGDGGFANICCRDIGLAQPVCTLGSSASQGCLCNGNDDCGDTTFGLPGRCCARTGQREGTCLLATQDTSNCFPPDLECDPATCNGVCCDDTCVAGECCEDADCAGAGFADGCATCNPVNRQCEPANDGAACDGHACGICDGGACIDRCPAQFEVCNENTGQCIFCNRLFGGCGECGVCNETTGRCEMGVCPTACETCVRDFTSFIPFVCRSNCAGNPEGLTDCCEDGAGGFVCTNLDTDDANCGDCEVACTGCQYCDAGACLEDDTLCTEAPVCNVGTCEANGACLYLPMAEGTACDTVPCGVCDGIDACIDACPDQGLLCNAAIDTCVECLDTGDCEPCETCESGTCVAQCDATEQCCPGDPDSCIPAGRTCCATDVDCSGLNLCADLRWVEWKCDTGLGYCASVDIENCDRGDPCVTSYSCDPVSGCSAVSPCGDLPCGVCDAETETCIDACPAQGLVCGPSEECAVCGEVGRLCVRYPGTGNQGSCCDGLRCYDTNGGRPSVCGPQCTPPGQKCPSGGRCCQFTGDDSFCGIVDPGAEVDCPV